MGPKRPAPVELKIAGASSLPAALAVVIPARGKGSDGPQIGSGSGCNLPVLHGLRWEPNKKGGFEAWQAQKPGRPRRESTYLGYLNQKRLEALVAEHNPAHFQAAITEWVDQKRREKGIL